MSTPPKTTEAKFIAYDTETGGTNPMKHPVLTAYFCVVSEDLTVIDELSLKVRPDLSKYTVEAEALEVNGIDLEKHLADPETVSPEIASQAIVAFITKHKPSGRTRLKPLGQNIFFDDMMIFMQLVPQEIWEKAVHYSRVDTKVLCELLQQAGLLPSDLGNLGSMVDHFGVQRREAHEARSDVLMTIEVYGKMVEMLVDLKKGSNIIGGDILSMIER